jgi:uncharacterized NAD(P)/FAD-binding protein YdhS
MPTVAIIGGGFSGTVTAVQLLRRATGPLRVVLIEQSGRFARGVAYGTTHPAHLLNVPAGNMSALADQPDDFVDFCRRSGDAVQPHDFVARGRYGRYLEALLQDAASAGAAVLERVSGCVVDLLPPAPQPVVVLADGRQLACDAVVLAFGHGAPRSVLPPHARALLGERCVDDPWQQPERIHRLPPDARVLLIGAGLTALDVLNSLDAAGHRSAIEMLSRRGLPLQAHRPGGAPRSDVDAAALVADIGGSVRQGVRVLRSAIDVAEAQGGDWRDLIAALRPHTPAWWQRLPERERRRFLRHLQPRWDVLRHRCAPASLDVVHRMQSTGQLRQHSGCIEGVAPADWGAVDVALRLRGHAGLQSRRFDAVINCTGPDSRLHSGRSTLIRRLLERGCLCPDAFGLGLQSDDSHMPIDSRGGTQPWLRYVGPALKARDWEAVAVPELRRHAQQVASEVLDLLGD